MNDRRTVHFLSEVGLYRLPANIAYGFLLQSTRLSTAFSRRPGGRLTNGRLPLLHFHHQRGCSSFRSNRISDELHRTEACLQNVAAKHTLSTLRRSLRDQTYSAHTGENPPQHSVDLRPENQAYSRIILWRYQKAYVVLRKDNANSFACLSVPRCLPPTFLR